MMFGDDDDMEAKRAMLEKLRNYGSERMMEGLKKKPDLSITIAAGPGGARPPAKLQEDDMDIEPAEPGALDEPVEEMKRKIEEAARKRLDAASSKYTNIKDPFAR